MFKQMQQLKTKVKKWGNSFGVMIPKEVIKKEHLKRGSEVEITLNSTRITKVKDIFGILKGKLNKSTEEIMREVDKDLWPEEE